MFTSCSSLSESRSAPRGRRPGWRDIPRRQGGREAGAPGPAAARQGQRRPEPRRTARPGQRLGPRGSRRGRAPGASAPQRALLPGGGRDAAPGPPAARSPARPRPPTPARPPAGPARTDLPQGRHQQPPPSRAVLLAEELVRLRRLLHGPGRGASASGAGRASGGAGRRAAARGARGLGLARRGALGGSSPLSGCGRGRPASPPADSR